MAGSDHTQLRLAEEEFENPIPSDLRIFWSLTDGQSQNLNSPGVYQGDFRFLSIKHSMELRDEMQQFQDETNEKDFAEIYTGEGVQPGFWRAGWIPFAHAHDGSLLCVDLEPLTGGTVGQVIGVYIQSERHLLAASFGEWLAALVTDLEGGKYRVDENGHLWEQDRGFAKD
ncbi:MAG: SMI1/KNR4 family protein [Verrucomicrobiota bacterium]